MTDIYDDIIMRSKDDTFGVVVPNDDVKDDYPATRLKTENLRSMLTLVEEMGWDECWFAIGGDGRPVFIEPADSHGKGELTVAPIVPGDDDE